MTDTRESTPSVVERTRLISTGAGVAGIHFFKNTAAFVLSEEAVLLAPLGGEPQRIDVHGGAILATAGDNGRIITGGDDGKVVVLTAEGNIETLATDPKRRWIDRVALGPDRAVAWSAGKQAFVRSGKDTERMLELPSTVGALAFAPKGFRLAIAHYNGASLWFPNAKAEPERLEWKGSHLGATVSPDGRFVVTAMQEAQLHGWRIADRKDMRMQGYNVRVQSFDWSADGKWLATSGSPQLILWPFQAKDGPMGKTPKMLAPADAEVSTVACHRKDQIAAVGYADGLVLIVRLDDGAEILAKKPGDAPVTALAWSTGGRLLAWGTEAGEAGIIDLA